MVYFSNVRKLIRESEEHIRAMSQVEFKLANNHI